MELIFTFNKKRLWDNDKKNKTKNSHTLKYITSKAQIRSVGLSDPSFTPGDSLCLHNVAPCLEKGDADWLKIVNKKTNEKKNISRLYWLLRTQNKTTKLGCCVGISIGNVEEEGVKRWGKSTECIKCSEGTEVEFSLPSSSRWNCTHECW